MSDGDTARETVGPDSHRDPEAWCSEREHFSPEQPRPGVPDGDITGPNGRGLVFRTETFQARTAEVWCSRTGTLQDRTAEAWCSRTDITGPSGRGLVFPEGDITGPDSQHGFRRVGTVDF